MRLARLSLFHLLTNVNLRTGARQPPACQADSGERSENAPSRLLGFVGVAVRSVRSLEGRLSVLHKMVIDGIRLAANAIAPVVKSCHPAAIRRATGNR